MTLEEKEKRLKEIIKGLESVVVAYSGGVDSTLVLRMCRDVLGEKVLAVTARSETYPSVELEEAKEMAHSLDVEHRVIETEELAVPGFSHNPPDRCYWCKKELFQKLRTLAREQGYKNVVDGANYEDGSDFRPGLRAGQELGVVSPLKEAHFTKAEVRNLSRRLGLSTWDKPSYACLASRFPYGDEITREKLKRVARAEQFLREAGLRQFRVRAHGDVARIEVAKEHLGALLESPLRERLIASFKELGFIYIALDLEGYRSGSMNEPLRNAGD
ncbi:MAG: potassium ABC transporter ATPase [Planctomycetes bacterium DG_23]|nr:MAG: potassium ABC transporter ATPase [Planctomycetes bacterium DG_23]